ncbi:MAG: hypothetical protein NUV77_16865 [Thermoguttaceae bacterium]|jgi:flagellar basal-body rod modification protein FlgD|nr:hypothetical protein [Thermoguttaceae bacterium]
METASVQGIKGDLGAQAANHDAFQELNLNTFVELLVAEMQAQDPLNPMDNQEILSQIAQIRAIESNSRLTSTLNAVLLGQNMATAGSLIGRQIAGLDANGDRITGTVDRVTVANGDATLHIGDKRVALKNVGEILPGGK